MKNSTWTRYVNVNKKMDFAARAFALACNQLANANQGKPFTSKSQAMKELNDIRKMQKKLSLIKILENKLLSMGA